MGAAALSLGLLLGLFVALLAVPLTVVFSIHRLEEFRGVVGFRWLFGLVRFQLRFPRTATDRPRTPSAPTKEPASPGRKKRRGGAGRMFSLIGQPALRRRVYKYCRDVVRAAGARNLFLRFRIGLGDPADTGRLWAVVGPVAGMAQNLRIAVVSIEPEFMDPVFEVESHGQFSLVPIRFLSLTVAFILSPTVLRAWRRSRLGTA